MSDQGPADAGQGAAPTQDLSGIESAISSLGQEMNQRFESLQAPAQQQQAEPEFDWQQYQEPDYSQQEPGFQYGQPQQQQDPAQMLNQALNPLVTQAVQQAMSPLMQRFEAQDKQQLHEQWEQSVDAVEKEFPELQDETVGTQIAEKSFQLAGQIAEQTLQQLPAQARQALQQAGVNLGELIAIQPGFFRNVYLAGKAQVSAEEETPLSTSQVPGLEPGGGAAVTGGEAGQNQGQQRQGPTSLDQMFA